MHREVGSLYRTMHCGTDDDDNVCVCVQAEYPNGMIMYRIDDGPGFRSIDELLHHYKQDSDRLPCRLTEFCPRPPTRMTEC